MKSDIIYLKLEQNSQVSHPKVLLEDVAEILTADSALQKEAGKLVLYTFQKEKEQKLVFSAMKVIDLLQKQRPELQVVNIGEPDFIVEFKDTPKPSKFMEICKAVLVSLIIFFGAGFTIMTFNTDVSVMEITYCVGIAIGILGFYNHFSARNEKDDPTPLHLEMRSYEQEMNNAIIKNASREGKEIS